ncbi:hypothetical protein HMPREF3196_02008 [Bifidobacterium bifidum]|uniref:Uncharacterized protein n=1 Tax=Bifidobacterium bifidum TaxID=1681 RepID=A0A133KKN2_BIFBI|nr:hypothetical protein HMPREF3196_02008 [Bifidobacterium bifidum]
MRQGPYEHERSYGPCLISDALRRRRTSVHESCLSLCAVG